MDEEEMGGETADPGIEHDLVKLVLARMESNPEEFWGLSRLAPYVPSSRWGDTIRVIDDYATEYEKLLVENKLREIILEHAYKDMLETLCADPEGGSATHDGTNWTSGTPAVSAYQQEYQRLLQQVKLDQGYNEQMAKLFNQQDTRTAEAKQATQLAGTAKQHTSWGSTLGSLLGGKK